MDKRQIICRFIINLWLWVFTKGDLYQNLRAIADRFMGQSVQVTHWVVVVIVTLS